MRGFFALVGFLLIAFLVLGCIRNWYSVQSKPQSVDVQIHTPQIKEDIDKVGK
jgi:hypothetical protein